MASQTAVLIGATGLVGKNLLEQLLQDERYTEVTVLHRRSTGVQHPKLREHLIDFDQPEKWKALVKGDHLYSAMGTTIKQAGSREAQYRVDYTYPYEVAQIAAEQGTSKYALVSSGGADARSNNFYLRIKGELDEAVHQLDFHQVVIMRPSFLAGDRGESRLGEKIGIFIFKLIGWLPGVRKYRPIQASLVAKAMIFELNRTEAPALGIYSFDDILQLVKA